MNQVIPKYDFSVIIGRFSPCHAGHKELIDYALTQGKKVIILIGSSYRPRTIKNPFTSAERQLMIESMYYDLKNGVACESPLIFRPINDYEYNDQKWAMEVQNTVDITIEDNGGDPDTASICLVGNNKDHSSWYLNIFPQWPLLTTPFKMINKDKDILSATEIRRILFETDVTETIKKLEPFTPKGVLAYLKEFMKTKDFGELTQEHYFIKEYKKSWEKAPYPPTFVTCDAIVVQSGHILLIQRRACPGRGLWAIVGGFVNQDEKIEDAMIRELREETKIKVPDAVLRGSIQKMKVYDNPDRSLRGRTITHAYYIKLPDGELARVKGSDDALKAKWVPLSELRSDNMFEDHLQIIQDLIGI